MEIYYLDILLQGVSLKGRHLGHVDVKAETPVISWRESLPMFSLLALILPLIITQYLFINLFNKHPWSNDWLCTLLASIQKEIGIRLNPCPGGIYNLVEEEEKTNEKIVTIEKDGKHWCYDTYGAPSW